MQRENSKKSLGGLNAGLDECGMGAFAGPLTVCVAAFPPGPCPLNGIDDSKKLTFKKRMELAPLIMEKAAFFNLGWAHPSVIDKEGLSEAWRRASLDALEGLPSGSILYVDGVNSVKGYGGVQETLVGGDALVWQISAASIVAKAARDLEMIGMGKHYPAYGWGKNMGYGSQAHLDALLKLGPSGYHRGRYLVKLFKKYQNKMSVTTWGKWMESWIPH
jgi:ribonuclease HII